MRLRGPRVVSFALVVCLQALTLACGARGGAVKPPPPAPRQTDPPVPSPAPPSTAAAAEPPAAVAPTSRTSPDAPAPPATTAPVNPPTPPTPPPPGSAADECALTAAPGEPVATVGLHQRIDASHAPHPSNDSERLVFRQLYETLVSVDCMGRARPGLASSWRLDGNSNGGSDGRMWIVTLRPDARFSDGSPVTAADVRAAWIGGSGTVDSGGVAGGGELRPHVSRLVETVAIAGERELTITLRHHPAPDAAGNVAVGNVTAGNVAAGNVAAGGIAP